MRTKILIGVLLLFTPFGFRLENGKIAEHWDVIQKK
jgi:predicted SnoaL-like aldol condensation-catalyzing enzyme